MKLFKKSHNNLKSFNRSCKEENSQHVVNKFYKINKNFLITAEVFLSVPIGIHKPESILQKPRSGAIILYRLHVMWCISVYLLLPFCIYREYTLSNTYLSTLQKPLFFSEYVIYLIHLLELIRLVIFRREIFWKLQLFILEFDRTLIDMKVQIHYDELQKFLRQHTGLIVIYFLASLTIGYFYNNFKFGDFLCCNTIYILPNIIINISLLQYYKLLFIAWKRGEKLNFLLDRLLSSSSHEDVWKFRNHLNFIRSLFIKLDKFTKNINNHFSTSIFLVYMGSFINISLNIFLLYKYLNTWSKSNSSWVLYSLAWTFMHIGKMFLILYYNQKVQNVKNKATLLLNSFKFKYPETETTFQLFVLQLMSDTRSDYVCGVAALNMNCIIGLIAGISTLFMFLVQYDITLEALTSTYNSDRAH